MRQWIKWIVVAGIIVWIVKSPTDAGNTVDHLFDEAMNGLSAVGTFFSSVVN